MFGYVTIDKQELTFREFDVYRAAYCGLCRKLREKYGISGQISLTYDMTFVILLLEGLYEPEVRSWKQRCEVHPAVPHQFRSSAATEYASDMNVLLSYYKCIDDWNDERKASRKLYADILEKKVLRIRKKYPDKSMKIVLWLNRLSALEKRQSHDIDAVSGCFGHLMEEIFVWKHDVWEEDLRRMGFFLGKYIYLLDAFEDLEEDLKNGNYNLFAGKSSEPDFDRHIEAMLKMMMAECCRAFEKLPVITHGRILRNILYSGVWSRYRAKIRKKSGKTVRKEKSLRHHTRREKRKYHV